MCEIQMNWGGFFTLILITISAFGLLFLFDVILTVFKKYSDKS